MPLPTNKEERKKVARAVVSLMKLPVDKRKQVVKEIRAKRQKA